MDGRGYNAMTDEQWGKAEQKIDQCLEGIKDIKGHIGDIYTISGKQETKIALVRNDVNFLQKVSWTIAAAVIVLMVGSVYRLIIK